MTLPLLLDAPLLQAHLADPDLLIVDLGKESVYQQVHVPGAVSFNVKRLTLGEQPAPGKLAPLDRLAAELSALGLRAEQQVVAYDDEGGAAAGRFLWTLERLGHGRYAFLDGGIHAWLAAGLATESQSRTPRPSHYEAKLHDGAEADLAYVLAQHARPDHVIWDARSPEEFSGQLVRAQRSGHIPGAVNYEWTRALDRANALRLRPLPELRAELAALGISADKTVITHCQTHHRSGLTWLLGKILGFPDIKAYAGSWSEWGNRPDTPIES